MADESRVKTPPFRLSYPAFFRPKPGPNGGAPRYSGVAIFNPADYDEAEMAAFKAMKAAMNGACKEEFGKNIKDMPSTFKKGLRPGSDRQDDDGNVPEEYQGEGVVFANITSNEPPGVINAKGQTISEENGNTDQIYPGCYCRAIVVAYAYDKKGNKGVALGLRNVMKVKDGDRLDSKTSAAEDFKDDIDSSWIDGDEEPAGDEVDF